MGPMVSYRSLTISPREPIRPPKRVVTHHSVIGETYFSVHVKSFGARESISVSMSFVAAKTTPTKLFIVKLRSISHSLNSFNYEVVIL